MNVEIPATWFVFSGVVIGIVLTLLLMSPLIIWSGSSSRRERELEQELIDAYEKIARLQPRQQLAQRERRK
jgi:hypothetical protein